MTSAATPTVLTYRVEVPGKLWTLNAERGMHWSKRSGLTKELRFAAKIAAIQAHLPQLDRARFTVTAHQAPRGRMAGVSFKPTRSRWHRPSSADCARRTGSSEMESGCQHEPLPSTERRVGQ